MTNEQIKAIQAKIGTEPVGIIFSILILYGYMQVFIMGIAPAINSFTIYLIPDLTFKY